MPHIRQLLPLAAALCTLALKGFSATPPEGFTALFNEKDLTGWRGGDTKDHRWFLSLSEEERTKLLANWNADLAQHWKAENGELLNDGNGKFCTTEKEYGDFELLLEYNMAPNGDSGVYLRNVPQVQIWDPTNKEAWKFGSEKGSGGLWNNKAGSPGKDPLVLADKPAGEWNKLRIVMVGSRVSVWLNDKLVVDHAILENYYDHNATPIPARGPLCLQTHGAPIKWRNIFLREIGSEEANKVLSSHGGEGFSSIWNGKDFQSWKGPVDEYEIVDGAIQCKPNKGGTIYWDQDLTDFVARVQFKLPAGGNNGLAIRYPGQGNTAYDGMCECQVLDDNYEKVRGAIDPRQAHGSAYGMVAAARGYQHPIGEWNFEEVTVKGSNIRVELNGTVILDTDLSKVDMSKVMANSAHPGKDRTNGFFGFAGHNDPVAFRNVEIKKL